MTHFLETTERGACQDTESSDRARHTHSLEMAEGGTCQGIERNRSREACSHSGDGTGRDTSGHGKKPTDRGALTAWIRQRERLVRRRKEIGRARDTHLLDTAKVETCQNTKRNRPSEVHSRPGEGRPSDFSEHGKKSTERGALTS